MTDTLRAELLEVVDPILDEWRDRVGTHYDGCWKQHIACLAVLIRDLASDAEEAS